MKNLSTQTLDKQIQSPEPANLNTLRAQFANVFRAAIAERNPHSKIAQNRRGEIAGKLGGTKSRFSRGKRAGKVQIFTANSTLLFCENKKLQFPAGNSHFAKMILKPRGEITTGAIKNLRENSTFCTSQRTRNFPFLCRGFTEALRARCHGQEIGCHGQAKSARESAPNQLSGPPADVACQWHTLALSNCTPMIYHAKTRRGARGVLETNIELLHSSTAQIQRDHRSRLYGDGRISHFIPHSPFPIPHSPFRLPNSEFRFHTAHSCSFHRQTGTITLSSQAQRLSN
jgi:hypothetical protein